MIVNIARFEFFSIASKTLGNSGYMLVRAAGPQSV